MARSGVYTRPYDYFSAQLVPVALVADANHSVVTRFAGFALRETSGAAAAVDFRQGASDGSLCWPLDLLGDESAGITFVRPMPTPEGVYVAVTGDVEGVLLLWR